MGTSSATGPLAAQPPHRSSPDNVRAALRQRTVRRDRLTICALVAAAFAGAYAAYFAAAGAAG